MIPNQLTLLAELYNTNKSYHGYTRFYNTILNEKKNSIQNMLEIGIDQGSSLFMWRDYFKNATIYGMDINIPSCLVNKENERIVCGVADQDKSDELISLVKKWNSPSFDIILDDGGHYVSHQRKSIEALWNFVKPGGIYIIEDLHTNIHELFYTHPHLTPPSRMTTYINEDETVHTKLLNLMTGKANTFSIPSSEILDIVYFSNITTTSLSCAIYKV